LVAKHLIVVAQQNPPPTRHPPLAKSTTVVAPIHGRTTTYTMEAVVESNSDFTNVDYTTDDDEYEYDYDYESDYYDLSAQQQWEESLHQLEGLFSMVLFPLVGKVLGRRFSHIIWRRIADWWYY